MTKIKRWVLVLSSVTIGSLRSSGFAAWKISNSIKNETSFDVNADGDVTEAESSFVKINSVDLPHLGNNGFQGDGINTPNAWNVSGNSDPLGYPIVSTGTLKVNLTLSHAKSAVQLSFTNTNNGKSTVLTDKYDLFRAVSSVTVDDSEMTKIKTSMLPLEPGSSDFQGVHSVVFAVPESWSSLNKTVTISYFFDLSPLIKELTGKQTDPQTAEQMDKQIRSYIYQYTNNSTISLSATFVTEGQA